MLAAGLARRVRASWPQRVLLARAPVADVAVHLVGAHQQEDLVAVPPRRLAQDCGAADIGLDEGERVHQGSVDMGLSGEVDDGIGVAGQRVDEIGVADVALDETKTGPTLELGKVRQVARVRQLVEHGDGYFRPCAADVTDEVRTDEPRRSCYQQPPQRPGHLIGGPAVQS